MANKKKKKKSNSYWMKYGGVGPTKMDRFKGYIEKKHEGGFAHPHPHPKNASDDVLKGAQIWNSYSSDGKPLNKRTNYSWGDDEKDAVESFKNTRWFDYYPDTSKNVPQTLEELRKYEEAIGAHENRNIELYNTEFDDFGDLLYGSANVVRGAANLIPHPYAKAIGWTGAGLLTGGKAAWDWYKRDYNTRAKENNPNAVFTDSDGNILRYEDNEHSLFNSFVYPKGTKEVRVKPTEEEMETLNLNINRDTKSDDPLKKEMGGHGGAPQEDPTFKMWFAKNARRSDVLQSSSDPQALKQLFLNDINFPGNDMPVFSNEINAFGNVDKSNRSMDLSEKMIGGMRYGGMPTYQGKMPKAELGMGQGLYNHATEGHLSDYSNADARYDNFGMKMGEVGDSGFMKLFNKVVPGLGTLLDIGFDYWGYKGEKKKHYDNKIDASRASDNLLLLNKKDANKETLDLSTRTDALGVKAAYDGEAPDFWDDFGKEALGDVVGGFTGGDFKKGYDMISGGGGGGDVTDIGVDDLAGTLDGMAKYGGVPNYRNGGLYANMNKRKAAGTSRSKSNSTISPAAYKNMQEGFKMYGGHSYAESGMDLRNLHRMNMGGANQFQPGLTAAMINGVVNPLSHEEQFKSSGLEQQYNAGGNVEQGPDYEAEGGEVIMHESGAVPSTTGETEQIDGEPNEAMLSMLQGNSHETQDPNGHTGEIVEGGGNQYVFSKSLKSKVWESNFAEAAEKIGKHISRFKKELEDGDGITKTTASSMIEAWNQKLMDLQQEQESARQEKFMEMVNEGAEPAQLNEAFPDLFKQFMAEQQASQLSAASNQMEGQAQMPANPMGDIDMSQLSAEDQQLIGAEYGLPNYENGGFDPFDFNRYFGELQDSGMFEGVDQGNFELGKGYSANKGELMDFLTMNYPDGGYQFGDQTYTDPKEMAKAIQEGFNTRRGEYLEGLGTSTTRPDKDNYMIDTEIMNPKTGQMEESWDWKPEGEDYTGGQSEFQKDKALWKLYNKSDLPVGWDDNYGRDAGLSRRKYFNSLETQLLSEGKSKEEVNSVIQREKMKFDETLENERIAEENRPLTEEEKAEAAAKKLRQQKLSKDLKAGGKEALNHLLNLAPTLYNRKKGNENPEVEQFVENENEAQIRQNLELLSNTDITLGLKELDDNFNQLKYLAREGSDGSSGSYMNTLLRGQNLQNESEAKLWDSKFKQDKLGLKIANESLFNLGERDRTEGVRVNTANAKNRAAVQAFEAKGWEGLSGYNQLQTKMKNEMAHDKQLQGLLKHIYPDAEMYINRDGGIDIDKLGESGELDKLIEKYPELKEIIGKYIQ